MDQNKGLEECEKSCLWALWAWDLPLPPYSGSQVLLSGGLGSAVNAGRLCLLTATGPPFVFAGLKEELKRCHALYVCSGLCVFS